MKNAGPNPQSRYLWTNRYGDVNNTPCLNSIERTVFRKTRYHALNSGECIDENSRDDNFIVDVEDEPLAILE